MCNCKKVRKLISRRSVLKGAAAGAAALTVTPILGTRRVFGGGLPGNNNFMVVINMLGGNDGLNSVIPAGAARAAYELRRANINLSETDSGGNFVNRPAGSEGLPTLPIGAGHDLHYSLAQMQAIYQANDLHVVNKVGYPDQNLSHFTSQDIYSFGAREFADGTSDGRGWLGRFADTYCTAPLEPMGVVSVGMGRRRDFEGDSTDALVMSAPNPNSESFDTVDETFTIAGEESAYVNDHDLRIRTLRLSLNAETVPTDDPELSIFNTEKGAAELVERVRFGVQGWVDPDTYENNTLGRNMRAISNLLTGIDDFRTKVFYTGFGGFDTHSGQLTRHEQLMERLDAALGAFRDDLMARGLWSRCAVVVISEFGRRNFENGSVGTDHGHGNSFFVAGGGVQAGVTGSYLEAEIADVNQVLYDPTKLPTEIGGGYDFREIYTDLIENHLGLSASPVFPETFNNTGGIQLF